MAKKRLENPVIFLDFRLGSPEKTVTLFLQYLQNRERILEWIFHFPVDQHNHLYADICFDDCT